MLLTQLDYHHPLLLLAVLVFGACIGSFLTLITYRLPLDMPIGMSRSRCPHCSRSLSVCDLLPVLSWLWSNGRCRHCHTQVHGRYPLTELACGIGTALAVYHSGITLQALAIAGLWWCIVAIIVTDLEHYIILDEVQIAAALFGLLYVYAQQRDWQPALLAALAGVAVGLALKYGFLFFCSKDGLGMGDVKFLGVAGIWLGDAANFVPFLFYSGVLGIVSGIGWRLLTKSERFPFGPALAMALLLCVVVPQLPNGFWKLYGVLP